MFALIDALISLGGFIRGLFVAGGFFGSLITWGGIVAVWFSKQFLGLALVIKQVSTILFAYQLIEIFKKIALISVLLLIVNYVINYALNTIVVYDGKSINILFASLIASVNNYGALGHNLLAFLSKVGFFNSLSLILTVMFYTLIARIALHIVFK